MEKVWNFDMKDILLKVCRKSMIKSMDYIEFFIILRKEQENQKNWGYFRG